MKTLRIFLMSIIFFSFNNSIVNAGINDFNSWEFKTGHTGISCGNLTFTDHSITIEFWMNITQATASTENSNIFESWLDPNGVNIKIGKNSANNNALELRFFAKDTQATPQTIYFYVPSSIYVDKWTHFAFVISSSEEKSYLYINGDLYGERAAPGGYYGNFRADGTTTRAFNIGGAFYSSPKFYGKLADVRVWSVARTANQIKSNYNKNLVGTYLENPGLFLNYRFHTFERGFINDANPTVTTNKGWCNPSTNWNTYYTRGIMSYRPEKPAFSSNQLSWATPGSLTDNTWDISFTKISTGEIDTISGVGSSISTMENYLNDDYSVKVRTKNTQFYSSWSDAILTFSKASVRNWSSTANLSDAPVSTTDLLLNAGELIVDQNPTLNSITIKPGAKLTLNNGNSITSGAITLQSTSAGTATFVDNNSNEAIQVISANVQQYLSENNRNWYIGSPIVSGTNDLTNSGNGIVEYNEETENWDAVTGSLTSMKGYILTSGDAGTRTVNFTGNLNSGNKSITLSHKGNVKSGYNLVSNPYPSFLKWTESLANSANCSSTIWYRTKSNGIYSFQTYNSAGDLGVPLSTSGYIPPMQAFWVKTSQDGSVLTVNNSMRSHGNNSANLLKVAQTESRKIIRLEISNGTYNDETVIYFDDYAENSFDKFDSPKMPSNNSQLSEIFTMAGNEKLVINGMKSIPENGEIELGFKAGNYTKFSLKASEIKNLDNNLHVFIKDKITGAEQDLTLNSEYSFENADTVSDRFKLVFKVLSFTTSRDNDYLNLKDVKIYSYQSKLIVENLNTSIQSKIILYNMNGQIIIEKELNYNNNTIDCKNVENGLYLVEIQSGENKIIKKVKL